MKKLVVIAIALIVALAFAGGAQAQSKICTDTVKWAEKGYKYVGENGCKTCHKVQYDSWKTSKHANAWAALKPEEQKKPECASCHMTGKNAADSVLVNVSCEACHGPGSEYKSMKNMKDPKLAAAAGLLLPNEATCTQCHNKNSPMFKEFKFAEAVKTGVHAHKEKAPAK